MNAGEKEEKSTTIHEGSIIVQGEKVQVYHRVQGKALCLELKTRDQLLKEKEQKPFKSVKRKLETRRRNSLPDTLLELEGHATFGKPVAIDFDSEGKLIPVIVQMDKDNQIEEETIEEMSQSLLQSCAEQQHSASFEIHAQDISQMRPTHQSTPYPQYGQNTTVRNTGDEEKLDEVRQTHTQLLASLEHDSQPNVTASQSSQEIDEQNSQTGDSQTLECAQKSQDEQHNQQNAANSLQDSYTGPSEVEMLAQELGMDISKKRTAGEMSQEGTTVETSISVDVAEGRSKKKKKRMRSKPPASDGTTTDASPQSKKVRKTQRSQETREEMNGDNLIVNLNSILSGFRKDHEEMKKAWEKSMKQEKKKIADGIKNDLKDTVRESIKETVREEMKELIKEGMHHTMQQTVQEAVEGAVKKVKDSLSQEIKEESQKCLEAVAGINTQIEQLKKTVTDVEKSTGYAHAEIETIKKRLSDTDQNIDSKIKEVGQNLAAFKESKRKIEQISKKEHQNLVARVVTVEQKRDESAKKIKMLEEKLADEEFPVKRTAVVKFIVQEPGKDTQKVAEDFIHQILQLPNIPVIKAKRMGQLDADCKGTMKILLKSENDLQVVLQAKYQLEEYTDDEEADIRGVWVRQSKTTPQLMLENHTSVLIRTLRLEGKVKILPNGRLIRTRNNFRNNQQRGRNSWHQGRGREGQHAPRPEASNTAYRGRRPNRARGNSRNRSRGRGDRSTYYTDANTSEHQQSTFRRESTNNNRNRGGNRRRGNVRGGKYSNRGTQRAQQNAQSWDDYGYERYHSQSEYHPRRTSSGAHDYLNADSAEEEVFGEESWSRSPTVLPFSAIKQTRQSDRRNSEEEQPMEIVSGSSAPQPTSAVSEAMGMPSQTKSNPKSTGSSDPSYNGLSQAFVAAQQGTCSSAPAPVGLPQNNMGNATGTQFQPSLSSYPQLRENHSKSKAKAAVVASFKARQNPHFKSQYQDLRQTNDEQQAHQSVGREQRSYSRYQRGRGGHIRNQARVFPEDPRVAQQQERERNGMSQSESAASENDKQTVEKSVNRNMHFSQVAHSSKDQPGVTSATTTTTTTTTKPPGTSTE